MSLWTRRQFVHATGAALLGLAGRARAQEPVEVPLPPRLPADRLDGPPIVTARAWVVADGATGRPLWGYNETAELAMASTTKIMTAWLVLRLAGENPAVLDETLTVSPTAARTTGTSARIRAGDRVRVRDLLYGLLLPSGNDAAAAFAEHFGGRLRAADDAEGDTAGFVGAMNREAARLRLAETHYIDPHGLSRNHTSARDLAVLGSHAMHNPTFRAYVGTRRQRGEITQADGTKRTAVWTNTNRLLEFEGYDGLKTGTTNAAGYCLAGSGRRGPDHLIVVVLGCTSNDSRYADTRNLFRWAWRERGQS